MNSKNEQSPYTQKLEQMLGERGAYDGETDAYAVLYGIALDLLTECSALRVAEDNLRAQIGQWEPVGVLDVLDNFEKKELSPFQAYLAADLVNKLRTAMLASVPPAPQADVIDYKPGTWFDATSVDLMQRFFESRLPAIREVAREHGYSIGVHGSMRRDMDLIAAPWREGASTADEVAHAIANAACGITRDGQYQWENKPAGRVATSIPICWTHRHGVVSDGHIDLSVMPQVSAMANGPSREVFEDWIRADSTLPLDRDPHGYSDMTTALMWHAWQAAVFASAPPAPQTKPQPLSDEQIEIGRAATFSTNNPFCPCDSKTMRKAVRWAEAAHGITKE